MANKLRKEFNVDLRFSGLQNGPANADRLILTGYEDKVKAALHKIQFIIDAEVKFSLVGRNVHFFR